MLSTGDELQVPALGALTVTDQGHRTALPHHHHPCPGKGGWFALLPLAKHRAQTQQPRASPEQSGMAKPQSLRNSKKEITPVELRLDV